MGKDEDLSQEERETFNRLQSEFSRVLAQNPDSSFRDWVLWWREITERESLGDDPLEDVLAHIDKTACHILTNVVPQLKGTCNPDEVRAWLGSVEALKLFTVPVETPDRKRNKRILLNAAGAIFYTALCRNEIETGNASLAAWAAHQATDLHHSIYAEAEGPLLEEGQQRVAGRSRGGKNTAAAKRKEHLNWLAKSRLLRTQHPREKYPDWGPTRIAREIAREVGKSTGHVRKTLRRLEATAPSDS